LSTGVGDTALVHMPSLIKYSMNANDDKHFAYNVLAQVLCDKPYIQQEFWGTCRGFKPDSILRSEEVVNDEGITIPNRKLVLGTGFEPV
jgi:hypothetical protein